MQTCMQEVGWSPMDTMTICTFLLKIPMKQLSYMVLTEGACTPDSRFDCLRPFSAREDDHRMHETSENLSSSTGCAMREYFRVFATKDLERSSCELSMLSRNAARCRRRRKRRCQNCSVSVAVSRSRTCCGRVDLMRVMVMWAGSWLGAHTV